MIPEDRRELLCAVERVFDTLLDAAEWVGIAIFGLVWGIACIAFVGIPTFYIAAKLGIFR